MNVETVKSESEDTMKWKIVCGTMNKRANESERVRCDLGGQPNRRKLEGTYL
jgi:hypothetical protein